MKIHTFYFWTAIALVINTTMLSAQVQQNLSNTHLKNDTGKPLKVMDIKNGDKVASTLFITGKEAFFDANADIQKGAGYFQAATNVFHRLVFFCQYADEGNTNALGGMLKLELKRIEWDDDGKTIAVSGVKPTIQASSGVDFRIKTSLDKPPITNGIITLDVEKLGKLSFNPKFGWSARERIVGDPLLRNFHQK